MRRSEGEGHVRHQTLDVNNCIARDVSAPCKSYSLLSLHRLRFRISLQLSSPNCESAPPAVTVAHRDCLFDSKRSRAWRTQRKSTQPPTQHCIQESLRLSVHLPRQRVSDRKFTFFHTNFAVFSRASPSVASSCAVIVQRVPRQR